MVCAIALPMMWMGLAPVALQSTRMSMTMGVCRTGEDFAQFCGGDFVAGGCGIALDEGAVDFGDFFDEQVS